VSELDELLDYVKDRHREYAFLAANTKDPAKKLNAEGHELAYFDVIKAIERIGASRS
jgi:hypothetical protein